MAPIRFLFIIIIIIIIIHSHLYAGYLQLHTSNKLVASILDVAPTMEGDTRWRSWLRHCATSRKVAGSIPHGVIGIFR